MNIKIKKLKTMEGTDGLVVSCDVYINNQCVGSAFDAGHGGELDVRLYGKDEQQKKLISEANKWVESLPDKTFTTYDGKEITYKMNMVEYLNELINDELNKKAIKAVESMHKKYIVWGEPTSNRCTRIGWKGYTLAKLCEKPQGKFTVQTKVQQIKKELKPNEVILNKDYLVSLGINV